MDFDFTTETITPDSTNILTIGGTGGLELPIGNTAARPGSPQNGIIRYNSDTNTLEGFFANHWASSLAPIPNQYLVQKNPGADQFSSIAAACAAVTGATPDTPWEIIVSPGTYIEPEILVPPYVQIAGLDQYSVIVRAESPDQNVFVLSEGSSLSFLTVYDATGPGFAGITVKNLGSKFALCHKVGVYNCDVGIWADASTSDTSLYLEYCDSSECITDGLRLTSSNGFSLSGNLENFFVYGGETTNPLHGIYATGEHTTIDLLVFGMSGSFGANNGHGIHIEDGVLFYAKSGFAFAWDTGVHVSDVGLKSDISFLSTSLSANTTNDLFIVHPGTTGTFNGTARSEFVDTSIAPLFALAYSDQDLNRYIQTGDFFLGPTGDTITNVSALIIDTPPVGLLEGGVPSSPGGFVVDISAGSGYLRKDGLMTRIEWPDTSITLSPGTQPYLFIDSNGVLEQAPSIPNYITNIVLGRVGVNATQVFSLGRLSVDIKNYGNKIEDYLRDTVGPIFVSGSIVSENLTTPRAVDVTAGRWYYGSQQRFPSAKTAPNIQIINHVAGVPVNSVSTVIPNTSYDNGTDLVPLTPGFFTKHVLYQSSDGVYQGYLLAYGTAEYATVDEAIGAPLPSPIVDPGPTPKIAALVMEQGVDSISVILDVRPLFGGKGGGSVSGTSVHGDLLGLDANDHPQYLLVDGTDVMVGDLDMGTHNIVNAGTINGITIQTHGSRHAPNTGVDPLPTASAVGLTLSSTNTPGVANSFSRSDHTHQITGVQPLSTNLTNIAAVSTIGMLASTSATTWDTRVITGTSGRISVVNGNGASGNPVIDIVPDAVLPGTGGVVAPTGTTAQRPVTTTAGQIRYNTDLQRLEVYQASTWTNYTDALYLPGSTYKTIQNYIDIMGSRGTFSGGDFTDNGDGTIAVTGGTGMIHAINSTLSPLYFFNFPNTPSVILTDNALNNIFVDYNNGTPQVIAIAAPDFSSNRIILGQVWRAGTTLTLNNFTRLKLDNSFVGIINRFQTVNPFQRESGAILSASSTGVRTLAISAGVFWEGIDRLESAAKDTGIADTFTYWYRNTPSSWVSVPGQTQIDNARYNNPSTGLVNLTNKSYGTHWVYLATNGELNVVYGITNTTNLIVTQESQPPLSPPNTLATATLVGRIIILDNSATFTEVTSAYNVIFTGGAVSLHNDLGGLQGGAADEYYHLTSSQNSIVSNLDVLNVGIVSKTGTGALTPRTLTAGPGIVITNGNGVAGNPVISSTNQVLDKSTVNFTQTGTTAANILSYTVPAGLLSTTGIIRVTISGTWVNTAGGNRSMTFTISYGGTNMYVGVTGNMGAGLNTTWSMVLYLAADNSATAQSLNGTINIGAPGTTGVTAGAGSIANSNTSPFVSAPISGVAAINSAAAQALNISSVSSIATNNFIRQFYTIELL